MRYTNQLVECKVTSSLFDLKSQMRLSERYITVLKLSSSNVYFYISNTL